MRAVIAYEHGDVTTSIRLAAHVLALARQIGDPFGEAGAHLSLGRAERLRNQLDAAKRHTELALAMFRRLGRRSSEAEALKDLGISAELRGDYQNAEQHYKDSLAIYQNKSDLSSEGSTCIRLGDIARLRGDFDAADDYFAQSLAIFERLGIRSRKADAYRALGELADARGDSAAALGQLAHAEEFYRQVDDLYSLGYVLEIAAGVERKRGMDERAKAHLREAAELFDRCGADQAATRIRAVLADWPDEA
jgi:tetratricopeptide (TPR) repeat protein